MAKVRLDVCMDREMKDKVRAIVKNDVKYRDLSHFVIVACDKLIRDEVAEGN